MKSKQIVALESYFKTDNVHWNEYTFELLCDVMQHDKFDDPELPLKLFTQAECIFCELHETPLQAVQKFTGELNRYKLSTVQIILICKWVLKYLANTEYENLDLTPAKELLKAHTDKLKSDNEPQKPQVMNLRVTLKEIMQKEIEQLSETLSKLDPVQRLNIICKLVPYVFPKVEAVHPTEGEPFQ